MIRSKIAILHYTAPPIVGGVEAVMQAHARQMRHAGYPVAIIAGRGMAVSLPPGVGFVLIPEMDSQHSHVACMSSILERGRMPDDFDDLAARLKTTLAPVLRRFDNVIVHNIFTKHFNLPLTTALHDLLDQGVIRRCIAWCHDFTWASPNSRAKVHPGYPWDLLHTYRPDVRYVVVSRERQRTLANLLSCPPEHVRVIYNGVDTDLMLGLSADGRALIDRLRLPDSDLILLMPVRVTQAKNIEYALNVVAALKARGCRPRLLVTGPPDPHDAHSMGYYHSLQDLRRKLSVKEEARFVFESGPEPEQPFFIDDRVVSDLYRVSDVMFMPSHREGFGMPVLEAGLAGVLVVCSDVPAASEIGGSDVMLIDTTGDPICTADRILRRIECSPISRLRRRVRWDFSWQAIFRRDIAPLLEGVGDR